MPEMVVVGTDPGRLVVLEGHLRLTAYALCDFPTSVVVIMGLSREMVAWSLYGDP